MATLATSDDTQLFDKGWGPEDGQPVKYGTLKTNPGRSHGLFATHTEIFNADLFEFTRSA